MRRINIYAANNGYIRRMARYIYQLKQWPRLNWEELKISRLTHNLALKQAALLGRMEGLGFRFREQASLRTITLDIVKSSEIEGEILNPEEVRSSVARRLGIEAAGLIPSDRNVDGVVEMMLNATQHFEQPLTDQRLWGWQAGLFPTGHSGIQKIVAGAWRDNPASHPMQVISGMMGREKVHFEAPASELLPDEMYSFLQWFNSDSEPDALLKAAIAHLWFITIHPFDDGNGRIARAITDMLLARADGTSQRFYSMSAQIRKEKNKYYDTLEGTQKGTSNITMWLEWFFGCLGRALDVTTETLGDILLKAKFWEKQADQSINERQRLMLNKILDGWAGKITSGNWATQTNSSSDTAIRDINDLVNKGILEKGPAGGRSTNYQLITNNLS